MIPRKSMVRKSKTIAELGQIDCDYPIKLRIKEFEVQHKNGSIHKRGPCLSLQQFNSNGHFLSAISIDIKDFWRLRHALDGIKLTIYKYEDSK